MNAFEEFGDNRTPAPVKARQRAARKRAEVLERKQADDAVCLKDWLQWRREELKEALAGRHGRQLAELIAVLKKTQWDEIDAASIVRTWTRTDRNTQALVTRVIGAFILAKREDAGLVPFDDPIPF